MKIINVVLQLKLVEVHHSHCQRFAGIIHQLTYQSIIKCVFHIIVQLMELLLDGSQVIHQIQLKKISREMGGFVVVASHSIAIRMKQHAQVAQEYFTITQS